MRQRHRRGMNVLVITLLLATSAAAGTKPTPAAPPPEPQVNIAAILKEFPSHEKAGRRWRNIVISPDNSVEALIALTKQLHAEDPRTSFWIYTDGNNQQFRRLILWDLHYAKADSAQYPYPKAWADRHNIAIINQFGAAQRWQLQILNGEGVKPPVKWGYTTDLD